MKRDVARAAAAVEAAMAARGWNVRDLARRASIDAGTVGDFLAGERWPRTSTRGRIETALGWTPGTISQVAAGGRAPDPTSHGTPDRDPDVDAIEDHPGYTRAEKDALLAVLYALRGQTRPDERRRAEGE